MTTAVIEKSKKQKYREVALKLMEDHYRVTGLNRYPRNNIFHAIDDDIESAVKSLVDDGTLTKIRVKGSVFYRLNKCEN